MTEPSSTGLIRSTPFEIATCWLHGLLPEEPRPTTAESPRAALEAMIRPALEAGPCYVTFSGGRDSSAVLAVAAYVARTEGLPLPIPVTRRYPGIAESDETSWQELVVGHLGLPDWLRLDFLADETDLLGPSARASVREHGVVWPPALHSHTAVYEHLRGGWMITGEGGDDALGPRRVTPLTLLRRRRRPTPDLLRWAGRAVAPRSVRRLLVSREVRNETHPWLRPEATQRHARLAAADAATEPIRYDDAVWWIGRKRTVAAVRRHQARIAAGYGITTMNPFLESRFLTALGHAGGPWGYNGRTAAMKALFSDLLPVALLTRSTKASFNQAYSGRYTREFAQSWDGHGVDDTLVDPEALRRVWLSDSPTMFAAMLLHSAWLASTQATEVLA